MQKKIRISYYALLRQERGLAEETITSEATTVRELYQELKARHTFKLSEAQIKASINSKIASWDTPINEGDNVLLIPPVAGG
jgi:molybdopterin converting factor small subunit